MSRYVLNQKLWSQSGNCWALTSAAQLILCLSFPTCQLSRDSKQIPPVRPSTNVWFLWQRKAGRQPEFGASSQKPHQAGKQAFGELPAGHAWARLHEVQKLGKVLLSGLRHQDIELAGTFWKSNPSRFILWQSHKVGTVLLLTEAEPTVMYSVLASQISWMAFTSLMPPLIFLCSGITALVSFWGHIWNPSSLPLDPFNAKQPTLYTFS